MAPGALEGSFGSILVTANARLYHRMPLLSGGECHNEYLITRGICSSHLDVWVQRAGD